MKTNTDMQSLELMKMLGIDLNPLSQLAQLVQLMNMSEAPGIQQDQFEQEMGMKEQQLGMQQQELQNNQEWRGMQNMLGQQELDQRQRQYSQAPLFGLMQQGLSGGPGGEPIDKVDVLGLAQMLGIGSLLGGQKQQRVGVLNDPRIGMDAYRMARQEVVPGMPYGR